MTYNVFAGALNLTQPSTSPFLLVNLSRLAYMFVTNLFSQTGCGPGFWPNWSHALYCNVEYRAVVKRITSRLLMSMIGEMFEWNFSATPRT